MKPTIVIVGRPNVGKSTLFNRLTKTRNALVADLPGLTRDRHYGHGVVGRKPYLVVDTGGFEPVAKDGILHEMARQTLLAVDEADVILFLLDARQGLTAQDKSIADTLRKSGRPLWLVVNKAEGMRRDVVAAEFFELGLPVLHGFQLLKHRNYTQQTKTSRVAINSVWINQRFTQHLQPAADSQHRTAFCRVGSNCTVKPTCAQPG